MTGGTAGAAMLAEIREQPDAIRGVARRADELAAVAARLAALGPRTVRLAAHGTSDNAATFAVYALGLLSGVTAFRDSISLTAYYDAPADMRGDAAIALSQSGETPDVVAYLEGARARGALTLAITNDPDSALAEAAELVVPLDVGPEHAVAATKTYTATLAALALLAACLGGRGRVVADALQRTADVVEEALPQLERAVAPVASSFAYVGRMFVIGRGVELATARELALKLQETCRIAADALTATDLVHGPVAAVDPLFPVWTIAAHDAALPAVLEATRRARASGAVVIAGGPAADEVEGAAYRLRTPDVPDPVLSPLVSIIPGQLFAHALALARSYDPDAPAGLSKVTRVP